MTFIEWCRQTSREHPDCIPYELVRSIMLTALKVVIEEFMANPANAYLDIRGIGRFYLNRRYVHVTASEFGCDEDKIIRWSIHFKPSRQLKETLNGQRDVRDFVIGNKNPLYPEYVIKDGEMKRGYGGNNNLHVNKFKVEITKAYIKLKEKEKRKQIEEKLPDEE